MTRQERRAFETSLRAIIGEMEDLGSLIERCETAEARVEALEEELSNPKEA